jgi:very-short-patch-repair endonuclease/DNA polymerase III delta prime subunit
VGSPLLIAEVSLEREVERRLGQVKYMVSLTTPFMINESLVEILLHEFGMDLREVLEGLNEATEIENLNDLRKVLRHIEDVVSRRGWRIEVEAYIAGLSFGTVGIYRDAKDLLKYGKLLESPIIRVICGEEVEPSPPIPKLSDEYEVIDKIETPLPADKYQCEVIWYAERGGNLVVHGPPGTGKSQTITNLIARLISQGKKLLFVAERREAIDVVYSRLKELGLTLPVLRVFTISDKERDEVLNELYNTLNESRSYMSERVEALTFPEEYYRYELEYFKRLTEDSISSNNLYNLIGKTLLSEEKLRRDGLYDHARGFIRRGIWSEYDELLASIHETVIEAYWNDLLKALRLPLQPNIDSNIPQTIEMLASIRVSFGEEAPLEEVLRIINLLKSFKGKLRNYIGSRKDVLNEHFVGDYLTYCLALEHNKLLDLRNHLERLSNDLLKLNEAQSKYDSIQKKLEELPNKDLLSEIEQELKLYDSWGKRNITLRRNYKKLRLELEEMLGIDNRIPHQDVKDYVNGLLEKCNELHTKQGVMKTIIQVYQEKFENLKQEMEKRGYENVLRSISNENGRRIYLNRLRYILDFTKNIIACLEGLSKNDLELVRRAPEFFVENLNRDLSPLIKVIEKASRNLSNLGELLRALGEVDGFLKSFEQKSLGKVRLQNLIQILNEVERLSGLNIFLRSLPESITFEQFKRMVEYLRLRDKCEELFETNSVKLDWSVAEKCKNRVREFYEKMEENTPRRCLADWKKHISQIQGVLQFTLYPILSRELSKKRRKISLRQLFSKYMDRILEIKPVLMMSPISVSALLPREFSEPIFDIIIFDEASQIRVERALPSIARAKQLVVIGDENQMPPSRYFEAVFHEEEEEEEEELPESLLDACLSKPEGFFKELWLKWYYRGSHESLIAFSNRYFYDNELVVMPSPNPNDSRVEFVPVRCPTHPRGGCYNNGINKCEVVAVVRELLKELSRSVGRDYTIGIVAMNEKQQRLIEDVIENIFRTRNLEPIGITKGTGTLDKFIDNPIPRLDVSEELLDMFENMWYSDRIWVRNLESVQGKEADYIILSMTYGRGLDGKLRQHFGPINQKGGERRLNVLVSRARERMIVVSSMNSSDIRIDENTPKGVYILREFLRYAEEGGRIAEEARKSGWFESPLEESVYYHVLDVLSGLGVEVVPQVGVGKYRIDLGIKSGNKYILGVECDGALYHKHKAARERDWIRERHLRKMGWEIYRIWSTTWFDEESRRRILEEIRSKVLEKLNPSAIPPPT